MNAVLVKEDQVIMIEGYRGNRRYGPLQLRIFDMCHPYGKAFRCWRSFMQMVTSSLNEKVNWEISKGASYSKMKLQGNL